MNDNIIKSPLLPDTIQFHHTMENAKTEVMRITREGVWVNPDMQVDETAKVVLDALSSQVRVLVQRAVEDEREACAKIVEADGLARGNEGLVLIKAAGRIRARGEKPLVKTYAGGKPNYCTPVDAVNMSQDRVDETAKGEHEPFIWVREDNEKPFGGYEHCSEADVGAFPVYLAPPKQEHQYEVVAENADGTYITKRIPKRDSSSWVGLTDEEIYDYADKFLYQHGSNYGIRSFGKAIEAKLKEKNA